MGAKKSKDDRKTYGYASSPARYLQQVNPSSMTLADYKALDKAGMIKRPLTGDSIELHRFSRSGEHRKVG